MFRYPNIPVPHELGAPIFVPGEPRGRRCQPGAELSQGVHPMPWPWLTGYITVTPGWIGGYSPPPVAPVNNRYVMPENLYTGIIEGIHKR